MGLLNLKIKNITNGYLPNIRGLEVYQSDRKDAQPLGEVFPNNASIKPLRMKLELALLKLTETPNIDQILFWGKIEGL